MAEIERLSVALPSPMAENIRKAVADGEYSSTSEVVRDALRLWQQRRHLLERDAETLRRAWDEGKAGGTAGPLNIKRILSEERARFRARKKRRA
jgi:antitoxin ParD1/3/4